MDKHEPRLTEYAEGGYALCVDQLYRVLNERDALRVALMQLYTAALRAHSKSQDLIDAIEATRPLLAAARAAEEQQTEAAHAPPESVPGTTGFDANMPPASS